MKRFLNVTLYFIPYIGMVITFIDIYKGRIEGYKGLYWLTAFVHGIYLVLVPYYIGYLIN